MPTERIGLTSLPLKELLASEYEHTLTWKRMWHTCKFTDVTPQPVQCITASCCGTP
jgi:hypothetical protein